MKQLRELDTRVRCKSARCSCFSRPTGKERNKDRGKEEEGKREREREGQNGSSDLHRICDGLILPASRKRERRSHPWLEKREKETAACIEIGGSYSQESSECSWRLNRSRQAELLFSLSSCRQSSSITITVTFHYNDICMRISMK